MRYHLAPAGVKAGDTLLCGPGSPVRPGNVLPLREIPIGTLASPTLTRAPACAHMTGGPAWACLGSLAAAALEACFRRRCPSQAQAFIAQGQRNVATRFTAQLSRRGPSFPIPSGVPIHGIELRPGGGGQLVRAASTSAVITSKQEEFAVVRLPSSEALRRVDPCGAGRGRACRRHWV